MIQFSTESEDLGVGFTACRQENIRSVIESHPFASCHAGSCNWSASSKNAVTTS